MSAARPEFSRPVALARLGPEPFRQEIAATEEERAALATRFDLLALDRLVASVELVRQGPDLVLLSAAFEAEFAQSCVVTLDPVPGKVSERFGLLFGPPELEETAPAAEEDLAFEPLTADVIDIGEAVAQEFSLTLPPFPRIPEATVESATTAPDEEGPFAALSRLADRERSR